MADKTMLFTNLIIKFIRKDLSSKEEVALERIKSESAANRRLFDEVTSFEWQWEQLKSVFTYANNIDTAWEKIAPLLP